MRQLLAAEPARAPEPHQWTSLGLADGVRADAAQSAGRALRAGPDRFEKGFYPVDDLEILGAETELAKGFGFWRVGRSRMRAGRGITPLRSLRFSHRRASA